MSGYTPQNTNMDFNYADRMPFETCDMGQSTDATGTGYNKNGNGTGHGCSDFCQIETGWECNHYFYKMLRRKAEVEEPLFRSECWETAHAGSVGPFRRRLSPQDFDHRGRYLTHLPKRYNNFELPDNFHQFTSDDVLKISPKIGLNGQVRIIEAPCSKATYSCTTADAVVGVVYGISR